MPRLAPSAASLIDAVSHIAQFFDAMGVRVYHQCDATLVRGARLPVIEIEPLRLRVDLERHTVIGSRPEDLVEVQLVRFAGANQPARRVRQDLYMWVPQPRQPFVVQWAERVERDSQLAAWLLLLGLDKGARKIRAPRQPELAIGVVNESQGGTEKWLLRYLRQTNTCGKKSAPSWESSA